MTITPGIYLIRRDEFEYATGMGLNEIIIPLPLTPRPGFLQRWEVRRVEGERDVYVIVRPEFEPGPPGGFAPDENNLGSDVIFKSEPAQWFISASEEGSSSYTISLKGGPVGVNFSITIQQRANSRPTLAVKSFSIEDPASFPRWVFLPVDA